MLRQFFAGNRKAHLTVKEAQSLAIALLGKFEPARGSPFVADFEAPALVSLRHRSAGD